MRRAAIASAISAVFIFALHFPAAGRDDIQRRM